MYDSYGDPGGRQHSTQDKVLEFALVWGLQRNVITWHIEMHRGKWSEGTQSYLTSISDIGEWVVSTVEPGP